MSNADTIKVAERLLASKKAREGLLDFCRFMSPGEDEGDANQSSFEIAPHHRLIAEALEKVEKGEITRLCISMPPGHGKSELTTRLFPMWFMGRQKKRRVLLVGYSETFAQTEFGGYIQPRVQTPAYRQVFPGMTLDGGSKAIDNLRFAGGGYIASVGKGGALTGRRGELIVVDDPLKGDEEAQSQLVRDKLWRWFNKDLASRLAKGKSAIIIIQTRWHTDDLIGKIMDSASDDYNPKIAARWTYLKLPAVFTERDKELAAVMGKQVGECLWPEFYPIEYMHERMEADPRGFQCLYQQDPAPDDGNFFKAEMLSEYDAHELPKNLRMYATSDHAVSTKQGRDSTVLMPFGVDEEDNIWVLPDLWWRQAETNDVVDAMVELMKNHKPMMWGAGRDHITKSIGPFLRKRMMEEKAYCHVEEMSEVGDKRTKAQAIHGRMSMGKVMFPRFAPWWGAAQRELLAFPAGAHDDLVDALSNAGRLLALQVAASPVRERPKNVIPIGSIKWVKAASDAEKRVSAMRKSAGGF